MEKTNERDYSALDKPKVLAYLFHPRPEFGVQKGLSTGIDVLIPVEGRESLGARFHMGERQAPNLLFFHGNGEIVQDYDAMGPLYRKIGINFLPVDYRGYGRSTGFPTVSSMMKDCHAVLDFVENWLSDNNYTGPLFIMGRSLGSASALELAANRAASIRGIVVESGFAYTGPLLSLLGVNLKVLPFDEENGFGNLEKIESYRGPTLVIHAEKDAIIPLSDGRALFDASPSPNKTFLEIPGANHNDIFLHGFHDYMKAVRALIDSAL